MTAGLVELLISLLLRNPNDPSGIQPENKWSNNCPADQHIHNTAGRKQKAKLRLLFTIFSASSGEPSRTKKSPPTYFLPPPSRGDRKMRISVSDNYWEHASRSKEMGSHLNQRGKEMRSWHGVLWAALLTQIRKPASDPNYATAQPMCSTTSVSDHAIFHSNLFAKEPPMLTNKSWAHSWQFWEHAFNSCMHTFLSSLK